MTTESKYQLVSLDESYMSDLSDENQSAVLGGTFGLLSFLFGGFGYRQQPTTNIYIYNNNTNTNTSSSSSGASAGSSSGGSGKGR